jgi:hypothetical protein
MHLGVFSAMLHDGLLSSPSQVGAHCECQFAPSRLIWKLGLAVLLAAAEKR